MHPTQIEDTPAISEGLALIGLLVFVLLIVGTCAYLLWTLPRDDADESPGEGPDDTG